MANAVMKQESSESDEVVRVSILGQEYPVRSSVGEERIREIAATLESRMSAIRQMEPSRPPLRIAILAALNLADELLTLRREKAQLVEQFDGRLRRIYDSLDRNLTNASRLMNQTAHPGGIDT